MGVRGDGYVVLAADQQCHTADPERFPLTERFMQKLVFHKDQALAIACGGCACLPKSRRITTGYRSTPDCIRILMDKYNQEQPLRAFDQIVEGLRLPVQEMWKRTCSLGMSPKPVVIYGAIVDSGRPILMRAILGSDEPEVEQIRYSIDVPDRINQHVRSSIELGPDFFGLASTDELLHASILRQRIVEAIAYEDRVWPEVPAMIGGHVDVVVVNADGCQEFT